MTVFNDFVKLKNGMYRLSWHTLEHYKRDAEASVAYLDNEPLAVTLLLSDRESGIVREMHSATRRLQVGTREAQRLVGNINRLLHWDNIRHYQAEGFKIHDWGGVSEGLNDGIAKFKLSFGGELVSQSTYLCAWSPMLAKLMLLLFYNLSARGRSRPRSAIPRRDQ